MNYTSYRLEFFNGVRFGHGNLDSTDISFHADTLFSALYQEALKLNKENLFLEFVENDRLLFSDMVLANEGELRRAGLQSMTEVKFENSISRLTAVANPRQIERAVRGSIFELDLIYEVEDEKEMIEDVETLAEGMRLLQYDYIGGSGSRGYGKIAFENIIAETVVGEVSEELLAQCNKILSQAIQE